MSKKTIGIICIVLAVAAIFGGIANGTFSDMSGDNIGVAIGFIGAAVALVIVGIRNIIKK